jgi:hypothetical protein
MSDLAPAAVAAALEQELEAHARRGVGFALVLQPLDVLILATLVQLALRHPSVPASGRQGGAEFLSCVHDYFRDCPTVVQVLTSPSDDDTAVRH